MLTGTPHATRVILIGLVLASGAGLAGCSGKDSGCKQDTDCPAGRYCAGGECSFDCTFDTDCPQGYRCSTRGGCQRWCSSDADCASDLHCTEGACVTECVADGECGQAEVCTERGRCEPTCIETNAGVEACDGLDNDCDGSTDEDWAALGAACANGPCPEGQWVCTADGLSLECGGPLPAADDSICDGLDEDCDGLTDEDAQERACALSEGVCAGATELCQGAGGWSGCDYGPAYTPGLDQDCDGLDQDCDGQLDEDAGPVLVPEAGALAGDGLDNNCNGLVDEPGGVMVPVANSPGVWIDAYEGAIYENADCSGAIFGQAADDYPAGWPAVGGAQVALYACSLPGVVPSGHLSWYRADRACQAQGKRLCSRYDWQRACNIGISTVYPYGMLFSPNACNDPLGGPGVPVAAGQYQQCTADGLTFDMSGNLAEWVLDVEPGVPGMYSVGGYGYACTVCRLNGSDCQACIPDDPNDEQDIKDLLVCDLHESGKNEFAREKVLPFFGVRCCLDGS